MLNMQEVFNKVCNHLLAQGAKSMYKPSDRVRVCAYRGVNGMQCAVGCLIDDKYYTPPMEGCKVCTPVVERALARSGVEMSDNVINLLSELQQLHDFISPKNWPLDLWDIATNYGLVIPPSLVAAAQVHPAMLEE